MLNKKQKILFILSIPVSKVFFFFVLSCLRMSFVAAFFP